MSSITSYNGRSTSPVEVLHSIDDEEQEESHSKPERISLASDLTRSITSNSKNLIEDSHSYADDEASPEQDEIDSQPERQSETQREATDFSDITISTIASLNSTSSSSCKTCECYCCSNISTPHHPLIVSRNNCISVNSTVSRRLILEQFKIHGIKLIRGLVCAWHNTKCIVQPVEQLMNKSC